MRDVRRHRASQPLAGHVDGQELVVGQREDNRVEVLLDESSSATEADREASVAIPEYAHDAGIELDMGPGQAVRQAPRQHFHSALNRVLSAVTRHGLQEVPQPDEPVGEMRLGGHIAVSADLEELPRDRIGHVVQNLLGGAARPGMPVVVLDEASIPALEWKQRRGLAAEVLDRPQGTVSEAFPDLAVVAEDRAVQNDRAAVDRHRRESQLPDQLPERIGADRLEVVTLGDAGLVHDRRRIESACLHLATKTAARFEQRDSPRRRTPLLEQVRRHQTSRPAANDRDAGQIHVSHENRVARGLLALADMLRSLSPPVNEKPRRIASSSPATR